MSRPPFAGSLCLRRHGFDRQREGALLVRVHRTDADEFASDLFATVVIDRYDDGVLPGLPVGRMPDTAFDAKRGERGDLWRLDASPLTQVMPAGRTYGRAFENDLTTMRTLARRPGAANAHAAHEPMPLSTPWPLVRLPVFNPLASSQPNSA